MAQFEFRLDLFGSRESLEEAVEAMDLDEARNLAELRLLMSPDVRRLTLCQSGAELCHFHRENGFEPDPQDLGANRRQGGSDRPAQGATGNV